MGFWVFVNGYTVPPNGNFNKNTLIFLNLLNMFFVCILLELIYHLWHLLRRLVFLLVAPSSKPGF